MRLSSRFLLTAGVFALILLLGGSLTSARSAPGEVEISVLSNRADLISGGNALVHIVVPDPAAVMVSLNGEDVDRQPSLVWPSFANGPGGEALGPPPVSELLP